MKKITYKIMIYGREYKAVTEAKDSESGKDQVFDDIRENITLETVSEEEIPHRNLFSKIYSFIPFL